MSNTGETTAAIYEHTNRDGWQRVLPALRKGASLTRPSSKLRFFYVNGHGGFTPAFIRRLECNGTIRRVGVDTYQLAEFLDA